MYKTVLTNCCRVFSADASGVMRRGPERAEDMIIVLHYLVEHHGACIKASPAMEALLQVTLKEMVCWQLQDNGHLPARLVSLLESSALPHQEDYRACLDWAASSGECW